MRTVFIHSLQVIFGRFFLKIFSFLTLPLLTFYIANEEMGVYSLLTGGLGIFVELASLGTRKHFSIHYFKTSSTLEKLLLIGKNLLVSLRFSFPLFFLLVALFFFRLDSEYIVVTFLAVITAYLSMYNEMYLSVVRFNMQIEWYNTLSVGFGFFQTGSILVAVILFQGGLQGIFIALFLSELVQFLYSFFHSRKEIQLLKKIYLKKDSLSFKPCLQLVGDSLIFLPTTLSLWLLMNIDQWMLGSTLGLSSVSLYGLAGKFPLAFDFLVTYSFIIVYTPFIYEKFRLNQGKKLNIIISFLIILAAFVLYYPMQVTSQLLGHLIDVRYQDAVQYVAPLMVMAFLRFASNILQLFLQYEEEVPFIIKTNFAAAILNILLNAYLIPIYGIHGAVVATIICFATMYLLTLLKHLQMMGINFART